MTTPEERSRLLHLALTHTQRRGYSYMLGVHTNDGLYPACVQSSARCALELVQTFLHGDDEYNEIRLHIFDPLGALVGWLEFKVGMVRLNLIPTTGGDKLKAILGEHNPDLVEMGDD